MPRKENIKIRRGSSSEWSSANPVLDDGELGYDKTSKLIKIGDASSNWSSLPETLLSVGPSMSADATKTNYLVMVSPVINFKSVADTEIFSVPQNHVFFIDEMEILTTSIATAGTAPQVRFGKTGSLSAFLAATQSQSNSFLARHIIDSAQSGQEGGTTVTFGITSASTAAEHKGVAIIKGFMLSGAGLELSEPGTTPSPGTTPNP